MEKRALESKESKERAKASSCAFASHRDVGLSTAKERRPSASLHFALVEIVLVEILLQTTKEMTVP